MIVCDTSVCLSVVFVQNSTMATNQDDLLSLAHHNYDQAKELYAINVTGCSLLDILSTILISPILCVIYQNVCDLLFKSRVLSPLLLSLVVVQFDSKAISLRHSLSIGSTSLPHSRVACMHCVVGASLLVQWIASVCNRVVCSESIVVIVLLVNSSIKYDDETKKNCTIVLTEGSIYSDRKGYLTAFRGIVVLYTFVLLIVNEA